MGAQALFTEEVPPLADLPDFVWKSVSNTRGHTGHLYSTGQRCPYPGVDIGAT